MKKNLLYLSILVILSGMHTSCEKKKGDNNIVPDDFKVGMSDAISRPDLDKKSLTETIDGNYLYNHLRTLVWLGELSSDMVSNALQKVGELEISGPGEFSYTSKDDYRTKDVIVKQDVDWNNTTWQYGMYIADEDGSIAFQLFWNQKPLKGIAMLIPGNFNRLNFIQKSAIIKIEYSEESLSLPGQSIQLDRHMIVSVTNLDITDVNYMSKLKLFVGQQGDIVYIRGNSVHPTAYLLDNTRSEGFCWTFVAKNNLTRDIAVAKVALPPPSTDNMTSMWDEYSMKDVLLYEVETVLTDLSPSEVESLVSTAEAPGYFSGISGWISSGTNVPSVSGFTTEFIDLSALVPYVPAEVNQMEITLSEPVGK